LEKENKSIGGIGILGLNNGRSTWIVVETGRGVIRRACEGITPQQHHTITTMVLQEKQNKT